MNKVMFGSLHECIENDGCQWTPKTDDSGARITCAGYTTTVEDSSGEWQLVLVATSRQDGRTAWLLALVQVDGNVTHLQGLDGTDVVHDAVNRAALALTRAAGWLQPLNAELQS